MIVNWLIRCVIDSQPIDSYKLTNESDWSLTKLTINQLEVIQIQLITERLIINELISRN